MMANEEDAAHLRRIAFKLRQNEAAFHKFYLPLDDLSNEITQAVQVNRTVKEVSVFCEYLDDESWLSPEVWRLFRALGCLPRLERLLFDFIGSDGDKLPVSLLSAVVRPAINLLNLELSCIHLTGTMEDFEGFSQALCEKPLRKLHIYGCYLSEEYRGSSSFFLNPVLEAMASLPDLGDAHITALDFNSLGRLSSESLGNLLHLSHNLRSLVLGEFDLDDHHLLAISVAMERNRSLKELSFGCELGALGADALGNMLRSKDTTLEILHIHLAKLGGGEDHHIAIANALRGNGVLKRFSLYGTSGNLTAKAQQAFADMMETNYTLEDIEFQDEDEWAHPKMEMYLKLNAHGRGKLLQDECATREDWNRAIIQLHKYLDCTFHLISLNPVVISSETSLPLYTGQR
jgi:hypothetical protein